MNKEEEDFVNQQQIEIENWKAKAIAGETSQINSNMFMESQEKGMIREQLDLTEEIERIEHLIRGHILKKVKEGDNWIMRWTEPEQSSIIFSEYGINLILNAISWYINKNTLLSNYDEETINKKMRNFATDLADTIFVEYEKVFLYPTFKECKQVLEQKIREKAELRVFAIEIVGNKTNQKVWEDEFWKDVEGRIEKEIDKIKEQIINQRLKRFFLIMREIQDSVHSTYLRALNGQERKTLREHVNISETKGVNQPRPQGTIHPLSFLRRRE